MLLSPVERLRRIWTPDREILERVENLEPQTEVDSIVRELFSRMVKEQRHVTLSRREPVDGEIRWEFINREIAPGIYEPEVSVWWVSP